MHNKTFEQRYAHRIEFVEFIIKSLKEKSVKKFSLRRVYAIYDTFQKERLFIRENGKFVVKMTMEESEMLISFKAGTEYINIQCPLERIKLI